MEFIRYLIVVVLLFVGVLSGYAQGQKRNLFKSGVQRTRHLQGLKGADLGLGISQLGTVYRVGGMFYMLDNHSIRIHGLYEDGRVAGNPLYRYNVDITYAYTPVDLSGFVFVNLLGGITTNLSGGSFGDAENFEPAANFGALGGIEVEAFVIGMVSFFFHVDQRVHVYHSYGRWRNYSLIGLRIHFK